MLATKSFLDKKNEVCRAGIIPYFIDRGGYLFFLLGQDSQNKKWADLGGTTEAGETVIETALREYGEESRWTLPVDPKYITKILVTQVESKKGKQRRQALCFIPVELNPNNVYIDQKFQETVPKTKYEAEMSRLAWIDSETLTDLKNVSRSIKAIQIHLPQLSKSLMK